MELDLPAFRFHPTEEELLDFYLKRMIQGKKLQDRKQASGRRPSRTTERGFWKATGSDRPVRSAANPKRLIGLKKTLFYYEGRAPRGTKTDWVMNEYRLPGPPTSSSDAPPKVRRVVVAA
ncbi:hypothetical protein C4D60_Mb03t14600 [Musa balbisiana]|uniref:NAC domain-containing protein n=1 Tax=Musa balbisiana TaxID=52838 RepID=A0A4S8JB16_MUSBA|nr:hypothetical protein C4D60_Mb03t14600 [Musa balbisiana]